MHIYLNGITWGQDMHIHLNRTDSPGARTCTYTWTEWDYLGPEHARTPEQSGITWNQDMHVHLNRMGLPGARTCTYTWTGLPGARTCMCTWTEWDYLGQDMHVHLNRIGLPGTRTCTYTWTERDYLRPGHAHTPERDYLGPGHARTPEQNGITWNQDMHIHLNRMGLSGTRTCTYSWTGLSGARTRTYTLTERDYLGPGHAHSPEQNGITWGQDMHIHLNRTVLPGARTPTCVGRVKSGHRARWKKQDFS